MITVYVVLINDRHADLEVELFTQPNVAIARARTLAKEYCRREEDYEEFRIANWLFYAKYSVEGDWVRVIERELVQVEHD